MTTRRWRVDVEESIFSLFPEYRRGVIWATAVLNSTSPSSLATLVEEDTFRLLSTPRLRGHPRLACWREVCATLGENSTGNITTFEQMIEGVALQCQLRLSTLLQDIAAVLSLWHLVPITVYALDHLQEGVALRTATGRESFLPQGASRMEQPRAGDVIALDGETLLMRNWNNSLAHDAKITCKTAAVLVCVDAMPVIASAELEGICEEAVSMLDTYCGSAAFYSLLSRYNPHLTLQ
jgi:DNA/RNA-binding domain of Phe-tRNA-synthetase-like protein